MTATLTTTPMIEHALDYIDRGFRVFPLHSMRGAHCSCGKADCSAGKHPRNPGGFLNASDDPAQIIEWWTRWPSANIGAPTGDGMGLWVLDIDPDKGGRASLAELEAKYGAIPPTIEAFTGGGGTHFYFAHAEGAGIRNRTAIAPGIDVRGTGGYIILPPSNHVAGYRYRWVRHFDTCEAADAPDWLLSLVIERRAAA